MFYNFIYNFCIVWQGQETVRGTINVSFFTRKTAFTSKSHWNKYDEKVVTVGSWHLNIYLSKRHFSYICKVYFKIDKKGRSECISLVRSS